jgi:Ca2+:H+ antiporter
VNFRVLSRSDVSVLAGSVLAIVVAGVCRYAGAPAVLAFVVAGVAVALLASVVGRSVEQLGDRFGPGATGVLQSALGNLPELFIGFFALQAGLIAVVQAAIIGSILSNILLVLGLSFVVGGLRNGPQRFNSGRARTSAILMVLATAALVLPSLAQYVHAPAAPHERELSLIVSVVLLGVFVLSLPAALKRGPVAEGSAEAAGEGSAEAEDSGRHWPLWPPTGSCTRWNRPSTRWASRRRSRVSSSWRSPATPSRTWWGSSSRTATRPISR